MARPAAADKSTEGSSSIAIPQQVLRAGRRDLPAGSGTPPVARPRPVGKSLATSPFFDDSYGTIQICEVIVTPVETGETCPGA